MHLQGLERTRVLSPPGNRIRTLPLFLALLAFSFLPYASHAAASENDAFASRFLLAGTSTTATASISGATHEPGEPNPHSL